MAGLASTSRPSMCEKRARKELAVLLLVEPRALDIKEPQSRQAGERQRGTVDQPGAVDTRNSGIAADRPLGEDARHYYPHEGQDDAFSSWRTYVPTLWKK